MHTFLPELTEEISVEEAYVEGYLDTNVTFNETPTDTGETQNVSESKDSD